MRRSAKGYGNYSEEAHRALIMGRSGLSREAIFEQSQCHPLMNPKGVRVRESRDSAEHPESLGIVFALDVTGSMGDIPVLLATRELPKFMKVLSSCSVRAVCVFHHAAPRNSAMPKAMIAIVWLSERSPTPRPNSASATPGTKGLS